MSNPTGPQTVHTRWGPGPTDCNPDRLLLLFAYRDRNRGEFTVLLRPGPRLLGGLGEESDALVGHIPQVVLWAQQIACWPKAR